MSDDPNRPWAARPPHLQRFIEPSGVERVYLRKGKGPKLKLTQPWGTQALADEAMAAAARIKQRPPPAIGTLIGAVRAYRGDYQRKIPASADYAALSQSTRIEYERWLDHFEAKLDGILLSDIDAGFVLDLRDKWAERGYRAANLALQVLKNVCKGPIIRGDIAGDPFARIEKVRRPHELGESNPRWFDAEVEAIIAWAIEERLPGFANAIALGRFGGFRRGTICRVPRRARIKRMNEEGVEERRIHWLTEKRKVLCDRREDPRLTALLDRTAKIAPRTKKHATVTPMTIAFNARNAPFGVHALDRQLARAIEALAKAGKVRPDLTLHGLRHARGVEIAIAGGSDAQIMAQLDHASPRQAAEYRRQAERLKLADDAQDRVDANVVKLAGRRRAESGSDGSG